MSDRYPLVWYWRKRLGYRKGSVVFHEIGHGLPGDVFANPHRDKPFRDAWKLGRGRARLRAPKWFVEDVEMHWTRAVSEAWADAFAWVLGARVGLWPGFGPAFAECTELVKAEVEAL